MDMNEQDCVPVELTSREQYLYLLSALKQKAAYILLVQIDGEGEKTPVIARAFEWMRLVDEKQVGRWPGTVRKGKKVPQYLFEADRRFFHFLEQFPSFFFNRRDAWGCDEVEETDFGQDDIAFLDSNQRLLFFTTTHEGYAYMAPSLLQ